jgi:Flp pilus assembly protein TadB
MNEQELKSMWQAQAEDTAPLSPAQLHAEAEKLQRRVGRRNRTETIAGGVVIAVFAAYAWLLPTLLMRIGSALTIAGTLFVLVYLHRRTASRPPPPGAFGLPYVAYYRAELVRQRDALASAWRWYLAPFVPGVVVFGWGMLQMELQKTGHLRGGPIAIAFTAVVFLATLLLNRRAARRLQQQIDQLDRQA